MACERIVNVGEVSIILDYLGTAYRQEVPAEALEIWAGHLEGVQADVAMDAAENIVGLEGFFPTVAVFKKEVAAVLRQRARDEVQAISRGEGGPRRDCPTCGGTKWYEVTPIQKANPDTGEIQTIYEQWKPCSACDPVGYSRWLEHKAEQAAVRKYRDPEAVGFDLGSTMERVRAELQAHQPKEKAR